MKRLGAAVLALGMTLALAPTSYAQTGRDSPQNGSGMSNGSMNQKGGSMGQKGSTTQHNNMEKGSSGTMGK
jgi:hypothetical protein